MRVVHMDSGLGNQMLDFAEYLAIRQENPDGEIYVETAIYDIKNDHDGMISQWNGYELERIFGIRLPLLKDKVGEEAWNRIVDKTEKSRFWENGWAYSDVITKAINDEGYQLSNMQKNARTNIIAEHKAKKRLYRQIIRSFFQTAPGYHLKRMMKMKMQDKLIAQENARFDVFQKYPDNVFTGHSLELKYMGEGIEKIDRQLREYLHFPEIQDTKNLQALEEIKSCNAVAIHARRSDMLFLNGYCYKYGFFRRSVNYIKKHVEKPVFFFFCDEKSRGWCEDNHRIFGLDFQKDDIRFITWNSGAESYRDMQLMAECKHNIFTESSFGFWGAYLNRNPDKITCAPDPVILATNWF